jgi:crotonobetainyl-CoA:carnitine CoA-transferase CaiB-like acyl-CoA transferase
VAARGGFGSVKHNRNKQSMTIDLTVDAGKELFRRMVASADVLVENFSSRVMPNFGLDYEALQKVNPRLVMMRMPGYGSTGPYKDYPAYGPSLEPMVGLPNIMGYPDRGPSSSGIAYTDCVAGVTGTAALMIAVAHQRQTGQGQVIDLSQVEATINLFGEYFLEYQATGSLIPRFGNRSPVWAPQGTYECEGRDEWVSLTVLTDEQWRRLVAVSGLEHLAKPQFSTVEGRQSGADSIDAALSDWTATRSKFAVMAVLQAAGIPAGAVLNAKDMMEDPHLKYGGFFVDGRLQEGDAVVMPGTPVRIDGRKRDAWTAAPLPGEHNREVLTRVLSLPDAEIDAVEASGALGRSASRQLSQ